MFTGICWCFVCRSVCHIATTSCCLPSLVASCQSVATREPGNMSPRQVVARHHGNISHDVSRRKNNKFLPTSLQFFWEKNILPQFNFIKILDFDIFTPINLGKVLFFKASIKFEPVELLFSQLKIYINAY